MKNLIILVEDAIYANDGYKSRIEMEMGILGDEYNFFILAPSMSDKTIEFSIKNVKVIKYKAFPSFVPFVFNKLYLLRALKSLLQDCPNAVVMCEALSSAVCVYNFCKKNDIKFVFDCHGTAPDEVYMCHKNIAGLFFSKWLKKEQSKVVFEASLTVTVSFKQKELLNLPQEKWSFLPLLPSNHFFTLPNKRNDIRRTLGIDDSTVVFVYSGQNQKWQMSKETIKFFRRIEIREQNCFLLVLTGQVNSFDTLCKEENIKNYKVISVQYSEMPFYLDACDYGFCLRADHIVNKVASPTKVMEYLVRNVRPVLTNYVGDFSENLRKLQLADIVDIDDVYSFNRKFIRSSSKSYVVDFAKSCKDHYISKIRALF